MLRDRLQRSLKHLGIPPQDVTVLKLLPLVHVAWAEGTIPPVRKERIRTYANATCGLGPKGNAVLDRWLAKRPPREYVSEGLEDIYLLSRVGDSADVDPGELNALIACAEAIARSHEGALDRPEAVSRAEEEALDDIARALHVDRGESWGQLLTELG